MKEIEYFKKRGKVVLCGGVFDILHPGHIFFLKQAKSYGNFLVVVVARDLTARAHGKNPIMNENNRLDVISSLKVVDLAILGHESSDYLKIISELNPDIIVLGKDQRQDENEIRRKTKELGLGTKVIRIDDMKPGISTSQIIRRAKIRQV